MADSIVKYTADNGLEVSITEADVRNVLCANPKVSDKEVRMFLELCRAQRLNPFTRDAYIVKYGDQPATIITGKDVFTKRAAANPKFAGMQAGITIKRGDGSIERREGSMRLASEELIGGWCKVYLKDYAVPMMDEVSLDEYIGKKKDGTANGQWAKMPATMIRKVAIVHALREAFPEDLQGLYDASEMAQAIEPPTHITAQIEETCEAVAVPWTNENVVSAAMPMGASAEARAALGAACAEYAAKNGLDLDTLKRGVMNRSDYADSDEFYYNVVAELMEAL